MFSSSVDSKDLQWHWDQEDRMITPNDDTNWKFQFDNELPIELIKDISIFIAAGTWHRLIQGTGDLSLTVIKHAVESS